ncbi:hypothetical protein GCM10010515_70090 [Streptomyces fructofermentans]|uniref:Uncharacterized protein n=1 Tax=Streptomyces fructofermentans TaxID=152141 RepID=A0A918NSS5_9ACTN|nr:hypothetical protein GCM10010515_70090 [Streptomyces fructofermentans]
MSPRPYDGGHPLGAWRKALITQTHPAQGCGPTVDGPPLTAHGSALGEVARMQRVDGSRGASRTGARRRLPIRIRTLAACACAPL